MAKKEQQEKKIVFSTKYVEEITNKINDGYVIKRNQNPWFKKEVGVRRSGLSFRMTPEEVDEYIRCKLDIHYFAEKYCKVKTEDGSVRNIKLRDYQEEILDLYTQNRFSILCASRQVGKCFSYNTSIITYIDNEEISCRIGSLYYKFLSKQRKLTFLERFKIKLYDFIYFFEKMSDRKQK